MITIRGEHYRTDYDRNSFMRPFDSMESLYKYLSEELPYGKKSLNLPARDEKGNISCPGSFNSCINFLKEDNGRYPLLECIFLIEENGVILFSSGKLTSSIGHVGKRVSELFSRLEAYQTTEYNFGD